MKKEELEAIIREADRAYYTDGTSPWSDNEYDRMKNALRELDPNNPLLDSLGEDHVDGAAKIVHPYPMLSLDKVQMQQDADSRMDDVKTRLLSLIESVENSPDSDILIEPKVDGMSAEARYVNGRLTTVSSRGRGGIAGDDITANVRHLFPEQVSTIDCADFVVRGELYISKKEFMRINAAQREKGLPEFMNARNLCAGTVKSKEPVEDREIKFIVHGFYAVSPQDAEASGNGLCGFYAALRQAGFDTVPYAPAPFQHDVAARVNGMVEAVCNVDANRASYDYCIDGAVVKLARRSLWEKLGATSHHPRWAFAVKFLPEVKETIVRDVVWQVSRNGKLTPVAVFDPVFLDGSVVQRATGNNAGFAARTGLLPGAYILVTKSNDVIPYVVSVVTPHPALQLAPSMPCPSCGVEARLVEGKSPGTENYICENPSCRAKLVASLNRALGSDALNVLGISEKTLELFAAAGIDNLMTLLMAPMSSYPDELSPLQKNKLYTELQEARKAPLHRWIVALQFPSVGTSAAAKIAQRCEDWETFCRVVGDEGWASLGITPRQGAFIAEKMRVCNLPAQMSCLLELNPASDCYAGGGGGNGAKPVLEGLSFVVTGTFTAGRKNVEAAIISRGGAVKSSVSKKTSYLVAGEDVGATKTGKAKELGTPILTEDEFFALLESKEKQQ